MRSLDRLFENSSRSLARHTSRRSMLATLGKILTGAALIPLLPVDRSSRAEAAEAAEPSAPKTPGKASKAATDDPLSCDYWKYCAVDGFLCSCCGGSSNSCPPGTTPSPITWIGTCHNPADARDYDFSAQILKQLGAKKIRLLSNNPEKVRQLENSGIEVVERVPCQPRISKTSRAYLQTKNAKMGHILEGV